MFNLLGNRDRKDDSSSSKRRNGGGGRESSHGSRRRKGSEPSTTSRKSSSRGDDRDGDFETSSNAPSAVSRSTTYPPIGSVSGASSYATAQPYTSETFSETPSKSKSDRGHRDRDGNRSKSSRTRDRSSSRDRTYSGRDRSISGDRSHTKPKRSNTDGSYGAASARAASPSYTAPDGQRLSQFSFPGQLDGHSSSYDRGAGPSPFTKAPISNHVPDMFPGQFPADASAPYRPPLAVADGGPGLAASYYGDAGESVATQPGVRTEAPSLIVGAEPHLMAASAVAAPPPEPSALGGTGQNHAFFNSSHTFTTPSNSANPSPAGSPGMHATQGRPPQGSTSSKPAAASSAGYSAPVGAIAAGVAAGAATDYMMHGGSSTYAQHQQQQGSSSRPPLSGHSASAGSMATGIAVGTATDYTMHGGSSSYQQHQQQPGSASRPAVTSSGGHSTSTGAIAAGLAAGAAAEYMLQGNSSSQQQHQQSYTADHSARPQNSSNGQYGLGPYSGQSSLPPAASGTSPRISPSNHNLAVAAGAAMLGATVAHGHGHGHNNSHHSHHSPGPYPSPYGQNSDQAMVHKHRHKGPLTALIDFFRDPEGVGKYEEYTEYIGVCKYCFEPGSSPRDAPRKHSPKRRKSYERSGYGSSTRVDKTDRYRVSDSDSRRRSAKGKVAAAALATGAVGYGLGHGFDDTYSVRTGKTQASSSSLHVDRYASNRKKGSDSYGIVTVQEDGSSRLPSTSGPQPRYGTSTKYRIDSTGHAQRRSRSSSRDRKSGLGSAALAAGVGAAAAGIAASSLSRRRRSGSSSSSSTSGRRRRRSSRSEESGFFSSFFGPSSNKRRANTKGRKKSAGFFNFGNASSSSSDSVLAFNPGQESRRRKSSSKGGKIKNSSEAGQALLGLGGAVAALGAAQGRNGSRAKLGNGLVPKSKHGNYRDAHGRRIADDEGWESASDDDSVDFGLAFGGRSSSSSSDSSASGTWLFGFGGKKKRSGRKEVLKKKTAGPGLPGAAIAATTLGGAFLAKDHERQSQGHHSSASLPSLQSVPPMPMSDSTSVSRTRNSGLGDPLVPLRPDPTPLQQPQPIPAIPSAVYGGKGGYDSYSAPSGPPVLAKNYDRRDGYDTPDNKPRERKNWNGRRASSPGPDAKPQRYPTPTRRSSVRFDFPANEEKKHGETEFRDSRRIELRDDEKDSSTVIGAAVAGAAIAALGKHSSSGDGELSKLREAEEREKERKRLEDLEFERRLKYDREMEREKERKRIEKLDYEKQLRLEEEVRREKERERDEEFEREARRRALEEKLKHEALERENEKREAAKLEELHKRRRRNSDFEAKAYEEKKFQRRESITERSRPASDIVGRADKPKTTNKGITFGDAIIGAVAGSVAGAAASSMIRDSDSTSKHDEKGERSSRERRSKDADIIPTSIIEEPYEISEDERDKLIEKRERIIARRAAALVRKQPSSSHDSYADFFLPEDVVSKPAGPKETAGDPNGDNDVQVYHAPNIVTIEPKDPTLDKIILAGLEKFEDDEKRSYDPRRLVGVPNLKLVNPTPPVSREHSPFGFDRKPQPESPVEKPEEIRSVEVEVEELPKDRPTKSPAKVTFGVNTTHSYEVESPEDHREEYIESKDLATKLIEDAQPEKPNGKETNEVHQEIESPVEEITREHIPGAFEDDIDMTATVAAGLEASGFDPDIVINDPTFRRRSSPPGSNEYIPGAGIYKQPFYESVSDIGLGGTAAGLATAAATGAGANQIHGWVEDEELPPSPEEEKKKKEKKEGETDMDAARSVNEKEEDSKLTKKERKRKEKEDRRRSHDQGYFPTESSTKNGDLNDAELEIINDASREDPEDWENSSSRKKDKKSKGDKKETSAVKEDGKRGTDVAEKTATRDLPDTESAIGIPLPQDDADSSYSYSRRDWDEDSKFDDDETLYESPNEYAASAASAPAGDRAESSSGRKHRKKRRSHHDVDGDSVVSTPAKVDESRSGGKKALAGNLLSMFDKSKAVDDASDRRKIKEADTRQREEEESRSKKKKRRSRDNERQDSESIIDDPKADDEDDKSTVSSKSSRRKSKDKDGRRSRQDSLSDGETGRSTRDRSDKRVDEAAKRSRDLGDLPPDAGSWDATESQSQSFLGERRRPTEPPDPRTLSVDDDVGSSGRGKRRSSSSPPGSRAISPAWFENSMDDSFLARAQASVLPLQTPRRVSMVQPAPGVPASTQFSPTAVPLLFRRPPALGSKSVSSSPLASPPIVRPRSKRPLSREFSSNEFQPLFLVERHKPKQKIDPEEVLPSLPSSQSTSRASSVHSGDEGDKQPSTGARFRGPPLDIEAARDLPSDLLDSQQTTPTADTSSRRREDDIILQARQEAIAKELEWNQRKRMSNEIMRQEPPFSPGRATRAVKTDEMVPGKRASSTERKRTSSSLAKDIGIAAAAGGAALAVASVLRSDGDKDEEKHKAIISPETEPYTKPDFDPFATGAGTEIVPVTDDLEMGASREIVDDFDSPISQKQKKKRTKKGRKASIAQEPASGSSTPTDVLASDSPAVGGEDGVQRPTVEERLKYEEQDTQDFMDTLFASDVPKKGKKGKRGTKSSVDLGNEPASIEATKVAEADDLDSASKERSLSKGMTAVDVAAVLAAAVAADAATEALHKEDGEKSRERSESQPEVPKSSSIPESLLTRGTSKKSKKKNKKGRQSSITGDENKSHVASTASGSSAEQPSTPQIVEEPVELEPVQEARGLPQRENEEDFPPLADVDDPDLVEPTDEPSGQVASAEDKSLHDQPTETLRESPREDSSRESHLPEDSTDDDWAEALQEQQDEAPEAQTPKPTRKPEEDLSVVPSWDIMEDAPLPDASDLEQQDQRKEASSDPALFGVTFARIVPDSLEILKVKVPEEIPLPDVEDTDLMEPPRDETVEISTAAEEAQSAGDLLEHMDIADHEDIVSTVVETGLATDQGTMSRLESLRRRGLLPPETTSYASTIPLTEPETPTTVHATEDLDAQSSFEDALEVQEISSEPLPTQTEGKKTHDDDSSEPVIPTAVGASEADVSTIEPKRELSQEVDSVEKPSAVEEPELAAEALSTAQLLIKDEAQANNGAVTEADFDSSSQEVARSLAEEEIIDPFTGERHVVEATVEEPILQNIALSHEPISQEQIISETSMAPLAESPGKTSIDALVETPSERVVIDEEAEEFPEFSTKKSKKKKKGKKAQQEDDAFAPMEEKAIEDSATKDSAGNLETTTEAVVEEEFAAPKSKKKGKKGKKSQPETPAESESPMQFSEAAIEDLALPEDALEERREIEEPIEVPVEANPEEEDWAAPKSKKKKNKKGKKSQPESLAEPETPVDIPTLTELQSYEIEAESMPEVPSADPRKAEEEGTAEAVTEATVGPASAVITEATAEASTEAIAETGIGDDFTPFKLKKGKKGKKSKKSQLESPAESEAPFEIPAFTDSQDVETGVESMLEIPPVDPHEVKEDGTAEAATESTAGLTTEPTAEAVSEAIAETNVGDDFAPFKSKKGKKGKKGKKSQPETPAEPEPSIDDPVAGSEDLEGKGEVVFTQDEPRQLEEPASAAETPLETAAVNDNDEWAFSTKPAKKGKKGKKGRREVQVEPEPEPEPPVEPTATVEPSADADADAEPVIEPAPEVAAEPIAEPFAEHPVEPVIEPAGEPVLEAAAELKAEVFAEPDTEPAVEPAVEFALKTAAEPIVESPAEPVTEMIAEQSAETIAEPLAEPATKLVAQPITDRVIEPNIEEHLEPVIEPITEHIASPIAEPIIEVVSEPAADRVLDPITEDTAESTVESITGPVVEPVTKDIAEPVSEPKVQVEVGKESLTEAVGNPASTVSEDTTPAEGAEDVAAEVDWVPPKTESGKKGKKKQRDTLDQHTSPSAITTEEPKTLGESLEEIREVEEAASEKPIEADLDDQWATNKSKKKGKKGKKGQPETPLRPASPALGEATPSEITDALSEPSVPVDEVSTKLADENDIARSVDAEDEWGSVPSSKKKKKNKKELSNSDNDAGALLAGTAAIVGGAALLSKVTENEPSVSEDKSPEDLLDPIQPTQTSLDDEWDDFKPKKGKKGKKGKKSLETEQMGPELELAIEREQLEEADQVDTQAASFDAPEGATVDKIDITSNEPAEQLENATTLNSMHSPGKYEVSIDEMEKRPIDVAEKQTAEAGIQPVEPPITIGDTPHEASATNDSAIALSANEVPTAETSVAKGFGVEGHAVETATSKVPSIETTVVDTPANTIATEAPEAEITANETSIAETPNAETPIAESKAAGVTVIDTPAVKTQDVVTSAPGTFDADISAIVSDQYQIQEGQETQPTYPEASRDSFPTDTREIVQDAEASSLDPNVLELPVAVEASAEDEFESLTAKKKKGKKAKKSRESQQFELEPDVPPYFQSLSADLPEKQPIENAQYLAEGTAKILEDPIPKPLKPEDASPEDEFQSFAAPKKKKGKKGKKGREEQEPEQSEVLQTPVIEKQIEDLAIIPQETMSVTEDIRETAAIGDSETAEEPIIEDEWASTHSKKKKNKKKKGKQVIDIAEEPEPILESVGEQGNDSPAQVEPEREIESIPFDEPATMTQYGSGQATPAEPVEQEEWAPTTKKKGKKGKKKLAQESLYDSMEANEPADGSSVIPVEVVPELTDPHEVESMTLERLQEQVTDAELKESSPTSQHPLDAGALHSVSKSDDMIEPPVLVEQSIDDITPSSSKSIKLEQSTNSHEDTEVSTYSQTIQDSEPRPTQEVLAEDERATPSKKVQKSKKGKKKSKALDFEPDPEPQPEFQPELEIGIGSNDEIGPVLDADVPRELKFSENLTDKAEASRNVEELASNNAPQVTDEAFEAQSPSLVQGGSREVPLLDADEIHDPRFVTESSTVSEPIELVSEESREPLPEEPREPLLEQHTAIPAEEQPVEDEWTSTPLPNNKGKKGKKGKKERNKTLNELETPVDESSIHAPEDPEQIQEAELPKTNDTAGTDDLAEQPLAKEIEADDIWASAPAKKGKKSKKKGKSLVEDLGDGVTDPALMLDRIEAVEEQSGKPLDFLHDEGAAQAISQERSMHDSVFDPSQDDVIRGNAASSGADTSEPLPMADPKLTEESAIAVPEDPLETPFNDPPSSAQDKSTMDDRQIESQTEGTALELTDEATTTRKKKKSKKGRKDLPDSEAVDSAGSVDFPPAANEALSTADTEAIETFVTPISKGKKKKKQKSAAPMWDEQESALPQQKEIETEKTVSELAATHSENNAREVNEDPISGLVSENAQSELKSTETQPTTSYFDQEMGLDSPIERSTGGRQSQLEVMQTEDIQYGDVVSDEKTSPGHSLGLEADNTVERDITKVPSALKDNTDDKSEALGSTTLEPTELTRDVSQSFVEQQDLPDASDIIELQPETEAAADEFVTLPIKSKKGKKKSKKQKESLVRNDEESSMPLEGLATERLEDDSLDQSVVMGSQSMPQDMGLAEAMQDSQRAPDVPQVEMLEYDREISEEASKPEESFETPALKSKKEKKKAKKTTEASKLDGALQTIPQNSFEPEAITDFTIVDEPQGSEPPSKPPEATDPIGAEEEEFPEFTISKKKGKKKKSRSTTLDIDESPSVQDTGMSTPVFSLSEAAATPDLERTKGLEPAEGSTVVPAPEPMDERTGDQTIGADDTMVLEEVELGNREAVARSEMIPEATQGEDAGYAGSIKDTIQDETSEPLPDNEIDTGVGREFGIQDNEQTAELHSQGLSTPIHGIDQRESLNEQGNPLAEAVIDIAPQDKLGASEVTARVPVSAEPIESLSSPLVEDASLSTGRKGKKKGKKSKAVSSWDESADQSQTGDVPETTTFDEPLIIPGSIDQPAGPAEGLDQVPAAPVEEGEIWPSSLSDKKNKKKGKKSKISTLETNRQFNVETSTAEPLSEQSITDEPQQMGTELLDTMATETFAEPTENELALGGKKKKKGKKSKRSSTTEWLEEPLGTENPEVDITTSSQIKEEQTSTPGNQDFHAEHIETDQPRTIPGANEQQAPNISTLVHEPLVTGFMQEQPGESSHGLAVEPMQENLDYMKQETLSTVLDQEEQQDVTPSQMEDPVADFSGFVSKKSKKSKKKSAQQSSGSQTPQHDIALPMAAAATTALGSALLTTSDEPMEPLNEKQLDDQIEASLSRKQSKKKAKNKKQAAEWDEPADRAAILPQEDTDLPEGLTIDSSIQPSPLDDVKDFDPELASSADQPLDRSLPNFGYENLNAPEQQPIERELVSATRRADTTSQTVPKDFGESEGTGRPEESRDLYTDEPASALQDEGSYGFTSKKSKRKGNKGKQIGPGEPVLEEGIYDVSQRSETRQLDTPIVVPETKELTSRYTGEELFHNNKEVEDEDTFVPKSSKRSKKAKKASKDTGEEDVLTLPQISEGSVSVEGEASDRGVKLYEDDHTSPIEPLRKAIDLSGDSLGIYHQETAQTDNQWDIPVPKKRSKKGKKVQHDDVLGEQQDTQRYFGLPAEKFEDNVALFDQRTVDNSVIEDVRSLDDVPSDKIKAPTRSGSISATAGIAMFEEMSRSEPSSGKKSLKKKKKGPKVLTEEMPAQLETREMLEQDRSAFSQVEPPKVMDKDGYAGRGVHDKAVIEESMPNRDQESPRLPTPVQLLDMQPLEVSIEHDPNYEVKIHEDPEALQAIKRQRRQFEMPQEGYPSPSPHQDDREPSPVDSTSKDRSAHMLFGSSPSTRDDIAYQHAQNLSIDEIATPSREPRRMEHEIVERQEEDEPRSIFGGPVGFNSDTDQGGLRSPPKTPAGFARESTPLETITESSPNDHVSHKRAHSLADIGLPEHGVKAARRYAAPASSHRIHSPVSGSARYLGHISTDDMISHLDWPDVDENREVVDLERSISRNTEKSHRSSRQSKSSPLSVDRHDRHMEGDRRSISGASYRSTESIKAIIRSPQEPPKSATPPLRRKDRSVSSDLRAASRLSAHSDAASTHGDKGAKLESKREFADEVVASSSTYDPVNDKGKGRISKMADVYEGWGDVPGSPRSPTRPPSMRRRQSMQILDLEARLDQLVSENRLLVDAKNRAERSLENVNTDFDQQKQALSEALQTRDQYLRQKDEELESLRETLQGLQEQADHLKEVNDGLTVTAAAVAAAGGMAALTRGQGSEYEQKYKELEAKYEGSRHHWEENSRELEELRTKHSSLSSGMEGIVRQEVNAALQTKDAELQQVRNELETAKQRIRTLQQQILAARSNDDDLVPRDEDYFDTQCQQLCRLVEQWVLRFSKFSDLKVARSINEIADEKISDRFDNAMLDGTDVDIFLKDRVRRRDVFMSVVMMMVWEHIFTRYLFGMDREQRSKLKKLEKTLSEAAAPAAVNRWRATTLCMLCKRDSFIQQRANDTEAVVEEIYSTLAALLTPPSQLVQQIKDSLSKVLSAAVDLSIEMRTQRAEYIMLPVLQPEYDTNGDLVQKVHFNASLMAERGADEETNEQLAASNSVVRLVVFPPVVKRGGDKSNGDEDIVVYPAQVHVASDFDRKGKKSARISSAQENPSVASLAQSHVEGGMF